jgi:hypothetical protein
MFEYIIFINSIIVQYICACVVTSLSVFKSEVMRIRWPVCCYIANWEDQYFENDFILQCIWASWDINYLKKKYSSFDLETTMSFMVRCTRYNIMWKSLSVNWNVVESCVKHHKTNQTEFAAYIILTNSVNATNLIILRFSMALSTV